MKKWRSKLLALALAVMLVVVAIPLSVSLDAEASVTPLTETTAADAEAEAGENLVIAQVTAMHDDAFTGSYSLMVYTWTVRGLYKGVNIMSGSGDAGYMDLADSAAMLFMSGTDIEKAESASSPYKGQSELTVKAGDIIYVGVKMYTKNLNGYTGLTHYTSIPLWYDPNVLEPLDYKTLETTPTATTDASKAVVPNLLSKLSNLTDGKAYTLDSSSAIESDASDGVIYIVYNLTSAANKLPETRKGDGSLAMTFDWIIPMKVISTTAGTTSVKVVETGTVAATSSNYNINAILTNGSEEGNLAYAEGNASKVRSIPVTLTVEGEAPPREKADVTVVYDASTPKLTTTQDDVLVQIPGGIGWRKVPKGDGLTLTDAMVDALVEASSDEQYTLNIDYAAESGGTTPESGDGANTKVLNFQETPPALSLTIDYAQEQVTNGNLISDAGRAYKLVDTASSWADAALTTVDIKDTASDGEAQFGKKILYRAKGDAAHLPSKAVDFAIPARPTIAEASSSAAVDAAKAENSVGFAVTAKDPAGEAITVENTAVQYELAAAAGDAPSSDFTPFTSNPQTLVFNSSKKLWLFVPAKADTYFKSVVTPWGTGTENANASKATVALGGADKGSTSLTLTLTNAKWATNPAVTLTGGTITATRKTSDTVLTLTVDPLAAGDYTISGLAAMEDYTIDTDAANDPLATALTGANGTTYNDGSITFSISDSGHKASLDADAVHGASGTVTLKEADKVYLVANNGTAANKVEFNGLKTTEKITAIQPAATYNLQPDGTVLFQAASDEDGAPAIPITSITVETGKATVASDKIEIDPATVSKTFDNKADGSVPASAAPAVNLTAAYLAELGTDYTNATNAGGYGVTATNVIDASAATVKLVQHGTSTPAVAVGTTYDVVISGLKPTEEMKNLFNVPSTITVANAGTITQATAANIGVTLPTSFTQGSGLTADQQTDAIVDEILNSPVTVKDGVGGDLVDDGTTLEDLVKDPDAKNALKQKINDAVIDAGGYAQETKDPVNLDPDGDGIPNDPTIAGKEGDTIPLTIPEGYKIDPASTGDQYYKIDPEAGTITILPGATGNNVPAFNLINDHDVEGVTITPNTGAITPATVDYSKLPADAKISPNLVTTGDLNTWAKDDVKANIGGLDAAAVTGGTMTNVPVNPAPTNNGGGGYYYYVPEEEPQVETKDADYGIVEGEFEIDENGKITRVPTVTPKKGLEFLGWSIDPNNENKIINENTFTVKADTVLYAMYRGTVSGTEGRVEPARPVTRAEMAKILVSAAGLYSADVDYGKPSYTDSQVGWYVPYVAAAEKANIISGYGNGLFAPNATITRQEAAIMIVKAFGVETEDGATTDRVVDFNTVSSWAQKFVAALCENGTINGVETAQGREIQAKREVTRAEVLVMVNKYLGFTEELKAKARELTGVQVPFTDLTESWYIPDVLFAAKALPPEYYSVDFTMPIAE